MTGNCRTARGTCETDGNRFKGTALVDSDCSVDVLGNGCNCAIGWLVFQWQFWQVAPATRWALWLPEVRFTEVEHGSRYS